MAKKTSRKELLKGTDEFLTFSSKAVNFITTHLRELKYAGFAIAIIVVAYLGVTTYLRYVNKNGQNAYNTAYQTLTKEMKPDANPDNLRKSEELFIKVTDDYGLSKVARLALPQIAYLKFLDKKYDEAIVLYRKFLDKVSGNTEYELMANLALAACFEAKGDLKTAMETLIPVVETPDNSFREPAMLSLARLYRLDNRPEKAREILNEFVEQHADSPLLPFAKAQL
ncbi:MAG: tetratricopeptide repeat protein [Gammaproteobacteria bacterium]|nr:tetratricopeptide repeat protein [Gammaproteobacteria bacterium]